MTQQEIRSKNVITATAKNHPVAIRRREREKMESEHAKMKAALTELDNLDYSALALSDRMTGWSVREVVRRGLGL
jgi:hypothetical protein